VIPTEQLLGYSPWADPGFVGPEAYTILGPSLRKKKNKITNKKYINIYLKEKRSRNKLQI
jgi:hypothetical protein